MTKDLALLVGADQKWLSTDRLPRQGRREPEEGDGGVVSRRHPNIDPATLLAFN